MSNHRLFLTITIIVALTASSGASTKVTNKNTYSISELPDMSAEFLNSTPISLSPLAEINRAEVANYSASIIFDPNSSNYSVAMTISFKNPLTQNLEVIPLNHWLIAYTSEFLSSSQKNDPGIYPNGFDDINLNYGNFSINGVNVNYTIVQTHLELLTNGTTLPPIEPNDIVTVSLEFNADVPNSARRYAKLIGPSGMIVYAMPGILPLLPVVEEGEWRTDPFDFRGEPFYSEVAFFHVEVTTPQEFVYDVTGSQISENTINGTTTRVFEAYPVRDWAMIGSVDYEVSRGVATMPSGRQVTVKSLFLKEQDSFGQEQLRYGRQSLVFFSREMGVEYPYDNYVLAQVVGVFYGGMEYPQLVLNAASSSGVVVHETAHQWNWGIIGMDQPHETWLDEGLTSFWTDEFHVFDGIETRQTIGTKYNKAYMENFQNAEDIINHTIYDSNEYVLMSYYKMPAVLQDLQHLIGENLFKQILKNFYRENRFGIGKATELINEFADSLNGDWIRDYFDNFLNTRRIPKYETDIGVLEYNSTHTTLQINFTDSWPGVPIRIELDTSADPAPYEASFLFDGNLSGIWKVPAPYFENFYFDPLRQNFATYTQRYYYVPPLYPPEPSPDQTPTPSEVLSRPSTSSSETKANFPIISIFSLTILVVTMCRKKARFSVP